jgi:hypothetical protein
MMGIGAERMASVGVNQTSIYNALVPAEGPKTVPLQLDFRSNTSAIVDFTLASMQQQITSIQSVWVDNFANTADLTITVDNTQQVIHVPARSQGSFPVIAARAPKITVATTGAVVVPMQFLNVPIPSAVWYEGGTSSVTVTGTVATADTILDAEVTPGTGLHVYATAVTVTYAAGAVHTVTTGGTAVTVFGAGTITNGAVITNPTTATESLYIDPVNSPTAAAPGANGTTFELAPGQSYSFPNGVTGAVRANAATNGHVFSAVRY